MNSINLSRNAAKVSLDVVIFTEGDFRVAYSPALDLAGQGKTDHEAVSALLATVEITIDWAREHGTLHQLLLEHGWTLRERPVILYSPPKFNRESIRKKLSIKQFDTRKVEVPVYA